MRKMMVLALVSLWGCGKDSPTAPATPSQPNRQPSVSITVTPSGQALMAVTRLSFTASGTDPDNDPLTYSWSFGNGSVASGATVSQVFMTEGTFSVTVTASDSRSAQATASQPITVRTVVGVWRGGERGLTEGLDFWEQNGASFTGKVLTGITACGGRLNGRLTDPRVVDASIDFDRNPGCNLGLERYDGIIDPSMNSMTGRYQIGNSVRTWTFTRAQ